MAEHIPLAGVYSRDERAYVAPVAERAGIPLPPPPPGPEDDADAD